MTFLITSLFFFSVTPANTQVQVQGRSSPLTLSFAKLLAQLQWGGQRAFERCHQNVFQGNSSGIEISSRQLCQAAAQSTRRSGRTNNMSALALPSPSSCHSGA